MKRNKQNLNTSPINNNALEEKRSVLFPFLFIKKMFLYFFEGLKAIILFPFKMVIFLYKNLFANNNTKKEEKSMMDKKQDKYLKIEKRNVERLEKKRLREERREQELIKKAEEEKTNQENRIKKEELLLKKQQDKNLIIEKRNAERQRKIEERLEKKRLREERKEQEITIKAELREQKLIKKAEEEENRKNNQENRINEEERLFKKQQEKYLKIEKRNAERQRKIDERLEKKRIKEERKEQRNILNKQGGLVSNDISSIEYPDQKQNNGNIFGPVKEKKHLFSWKNVATKSNQIDLSLVQEKTEKELKKEAELLRKEQEKFVKAEEKRKLLEKRNEEKEVAKKAKELVLEQKREIRQEKINAKKKKQEEKVKLMLEKKRLKEKLLIDKIEKEAKIKKEREESIKSRKENASKLKQAKLEEKEKSEETIPFKEKFKKWYNNLSIIKDRENKAELARQVLLINFEGEDAVRSEQKIYYKYVAKKVDTGVVETGYFPAFSKLDVHSFLLSEGYEVYEITPQRSYGNGVFSKFNKGKIKVTDLVFFLTQLSTFLKSGLPLLDSIKILEKQTDTRKAKLRNLYKSIAYELTMGENFSDSLEKQGDSFPKLLVNMIKSSEMAGNLPEVLDDMAVYYDEMNKTRKQMKSAMTYPLVIFSFATLVIIFILVFVIPEFVGIYREMEAELPDITKAIINISKFLQKNIIYIVVGIALLIFLFKYLYKSIKVFRIFVQYTMMHTPVFGKIIMYNEVTIFTKTFGSLLNHNVFITDSMEVLSKITENEIYKMLIFDTITNLAKGSPISNAFKNQWAFPTIAYEMLLTGEKTGELGDMMMKVSNFYQLQHKNAVNQIKTFIEPIMIVVLTVLVGIILMSVILPMFNMYQEIM